MTKFTSLKCPVCGKTYKEVGTFCNHMRAEHPGTIPKDWSDLRYAYFVHTGKSAGRCRECKGDTPWNEVAGRYAKICGSLACRQAYRDRFMASMRARHGKTNLMDDPNYRERVLTGRKISGKYTFQDGGEVAYMGKLEEAFLKMLDTFFNFPSCDIISPSPNRYLYDYHNPNDPENEGEHIYVPDFFIPSCNLEIELKTSRNERPRNLLIDVPRDACKDIHMIRHPLINYCKVYEDDYYVFFQVFADLAAQSLSGEERRVKYISRSLLTSIYRDYIPDDCLAIIDKYIYKYSEKSVLARPRRRKATESEEYVPNDTELPVIEGPDEEEEQDDTEFHIEDVYGTEPEEDVAEAFQEDTAEPVEETFRMQLLPLGRHRGHVFINENAGLECFNFDSHYAGAFEATLAEQLGVDTGKIDGRAAVTHSRWRDRLFGNKLFGNQAAKIFSKVEVKDGNILIKGINANLLLYRIKDVYDEGRLKYIFEYRYNDKSWKMYQKRKIGKGDMKIDYVYAPEFFCLELVELFNDLSIHYNDRSYAQIAQLIYEASWLSKADKINVPPMSTDALKNLRLTLLPHQVKFIEQWPQLKSQLNTHGYILAFQPGKGKTITSVGLAECLGAKKVYIVCPNNLKDNWALELRKYFAAYDDEKKWMEEVCILGTRYGNPETAKWIITNNENIKLMMPIAKHDPNAMLILDECHNFRNFEGGRSKELFALADKIGSENVLAVSATPIKAAPAEITPVLRIIDPTFTDEAAAMYAKCFNLSNTDAMILVNKRFGKIIYRPADVAVDLPPKNLHNLALGVSDEARFYLTNVHDEIISRFKEKHDKWLSTAKVIVENFRKSIDQYSMADKRLTHGYKEWVMYAANTLQDRGEDFHDLDVKDFKNFIDLFIRPNPKCPATVADSLQQIHNELVTAAKRHMGYSIGEILPPRRCELYKKLWSENATMFYEMIRNRGKKTIIFSTMVPVIRHIVKDLNDFGINAVSITGETKNRLEILTQFRDDPNTLVLVATSYCMGVGVTLTEASQMFFFGTPWRSTDFEQACDRIWRIGQTDTVDIHTVMCKSKQKNLTDRMQDILEWSERMFGAAITTSELGEENPDANGTTATESVIYTYDGVMEQKRPLIGKSIRTMMKILDDFEYGLYKDGKITDPDDPHMYDQYYRTASPGNFIKHHGGVCHDFAAYQDFFLRAQSLQSNVYFVGVYYPAGDSFAYKTHTFTLCHNDPRCLIYPENAMDSLKGVWRASTIDEVVSCIINNMGLPSIPNKKDIEVYQLRVNYKGYDETMAQFFDRVHKTGIPISVRYSYMVKTLEPYDLNDIPGEAPATEAIGEDLSTISEAYELLDEHELQFLRRLQRVADLFADYAYDLDGTAEHSISSAPVINGMHVMSKLKVVSAISDILRGDDVGHMVFLLRYRDPLLLKITGQSTICHPIIVVPFKNFCFAIEGALNPKRNALYVCESIEELASAIGRWLLDYVDRRKYCIRTSEYKPTIELVQLSINDIALQNIATMDNPDPEDFVASTSKVGRVDFNRNTTELHQVEVFQYGWLIRREW